MVNHSLTEGLVGCPTYNFIVTPAHVAWSLNPSVHTLGNMSGSGEEIRQ